MSRFVPQPDLLQGSERTNKKRAVRISKVFLAIAVLAGFIAVKDQTTAREKALPQLQKDSLKTIIVRVVSTADCANTPPTIQLIKDIAFELGLRVDVTRQIVSTQAEAEHYRFIGSPTVQIAGLDLQPEMRKNLKYGFA